MSLSFVLVGLFAVASADSLRSQIQAFDAKIHDAMMKKDIATFSKVMRPESTADFKYIESGQSMNFDQMVSMMQQGLGRLTKVTEAKTEILTLTKTKDRATSTTRHTMAGTMVGPDKKSHVMKFVGQSLDTYRKEGGVWKMAKMEWKNQKSYLDGKEFDPRKMGG